MEFSRKDQRFEKKKKWTKKKRCGLRLLEMYKGKIQLNNLTILFQLINASYKITRNYRWDY